MIIDAAGIGDTLVDFNPVFDYRRYEAHREAWVEYFRDEVHRLQIENQRLRALLSHQNID